MIATTLALLTCLAPQDSTRKATARDITPYVNGFMLYRGKLPNAPLNFMWPTPESEFKSTKRVTIDLGGKSHEFRQTDAVGVGNIECVLTEYVGEPGAVRPLHTALSKRFDEWSRREAHEIGGDKAVANLSKAVRVDSAGFLAKYAVFTDHWVRQGMIRDYDRYDDHATFCILADDFFVFGRFYIGDGITLSDDQIDGLVRFTGDGWAINTVVTREFTERLVRRMLRSSALSNGS